MTPSPLRDDWPQRRSAEAMRTRLSAPGWAFDPSYLTGLALAVLPRFCAAIETGEAIAMLPRPAWWRRRIEDHARVLHGMDACDGMRTIVALRLEPKSYDLLFISMSVGNWTVPTLMRSGGDLVALAAWRWNIGDAKAAWRVARLAGVSRPLP